jgi:hypothetical protein
MRQPGSNLRWQPLAAILAVVVATGHASPALAWNKAGHMVSGAIAYAVLKQDSPRALAAVITLLKVHPAYKEKWEPLIQRPFVPEDQRDLYLFMLATRWADDARGDLVAYPPDLFLDRAHYINLPFKPDDQPAEVQTAPANAEINLFTWYARSVKTLSQDVPAADRAVALSWVFHLVGDVHQPLHTASRFTTDFQKDEEGKLVGDRGGTRCFIRAKEGAAVIPLHQFWDGLILGSDRFQDVRNRAIELRLRPAFARAKLAELGEPNLEKWGRVESFALAKEVAYRQGKLRGSPSRLGAPILPEDYAKQAQAVAERRIVLAGYRLAAVLKKQFDSSTSQ